MRKDKKNQETQMNKKLYNEIIENGRVTAEIEEKFFPGADFMAIRNKLEEIGLDRHYPIELSSTEIALVTPFGVLMQIRPVDRDQLGVWGGILEAGETPREGAVRELKEETGIEIDESDLEFVEINESFHEYANGDKVFFKAHRFIVHFNYVPKVITDEESVGVVMVAHTIIDHQQNFIKRVLGEL